MAEYLEATLGALAVGLKLWNDVDWGHVEYVDEETDNIWADINTQLSRRASKLREMHVTIRLKGTDKDDLFDQENDLRDELRKAVNTLVVKPRNASRATTWTVLRNPATSAPFDMRYEKANLAYCDVVLICEPWGYGPTEAPVVALAGESPQIVDLGDLVGHGDPPLSVDLARRWGAANDGDGMQHVVVALCPSGAAVSDLFYDAEDALPAADWSNQAQANARGGHYAQLDANDAWTPLPHAVQSSLRPGRYRVYARAKTSSSGEDNYLAKRKQTGTARDPKTRSVLTTSWQWHDLGEWVHTGAEGMRLYGYSGSGWLGVDFVIMVPIDWYWMSYTDNDEATGVVHFGWLYDQQAGSTGVTPTMSDATARVRGHGLKCPIEGFSMLVLIEAAAGSNPSPDFTLDVSYRPRWESFR